MHAALAVSLLLRSRLLSEGRAASHHSERMELQPVVYGSFPHFATPPNLPAGQIPGGFLREATTFGMTIAFEHSQKKAQLLGESTAVTVCPGWKRRTEGSIKEECMAEHQPSKAGEYERPGTMDLTSLRLMIGIIVLLAMIIAPILFFR